MVVHEIGGGGDIQCGGGGIGDAQRIDAAFQLAVGLEQYAALGLQASLDALVLHAIYDGRQFVDLLLHAFMSRHRERIRLQLTGEVDAKRQGPFLVGLQTHHDDVVGLRGKDRANVFHAIIGIRGGGGGITQVEVPAIAVHVLMLQVDSHVAERQELHAVRAFDEILVDYLVGFLLLAGEDEVSHLLQVRLGLGTVVVVWTARPEGLLVELDCLHVGAPIDHGAEMGVAYRERLQPVGGRFRVPELVLLRHRLLRRADEQDEEQKKQTEVSKMFHTVDNDSFCKNSAFQRENHHQRAKKCKRKRPAALSTVFPLLSMHKPRHRPGHYGAG